MAQLLQDPLSPRKQVEYAKKIGADAVAHGSTGKGNDQVRFEIGYYATDPHIKIIAPWRLWDLKSRDSLIQFAQKYQIQIPKDKIGEPPFSIDENVLHTSAEGKVLEDPWMRLLQIMFFQEQKILKILLIKLKK